MKTGSESVDAIMRGRRTLFVGFVARMEDTRLPNRVMFGRVMGERAERADESRHVRKGDGGAGESRHVRKGDGGAGGAG